MSHFVVYVLGEDVETQLAPYHEFECTGDDNQYVQQIDNTAEMHRDFEKYGKEGQTFKAFLEYWIDASCINPTTTKPDLTSPDHKYGWVEVVSHRELESVLRHQAPPVKQKTS